MDTTEVQDVSLLKNSFLSVARRDIEEKNVHYYVQVINLVLGAMFLLPIRICLFLSALLVWQLPVYLLLKSYLFYRKTVYGEDSIQIETTSKAYNEIIRKPYLHYASSFWANIFYLNTFYFHRFSEMMLANWWIKVIDAEKNIDPNVQILVGAPHICIGDKAFDLSMMKKALYKSKSDRKVYVFSRAENKSWWFDAMDWIYIDRNHRNSRREGIETAIHRLNSEDWANHSLAIMPEGTTHNGNVMTYFNKGAFIYKKPVQPLNLEYSEAFTGLFLSDKTRKQRGAGWAGWPAEVATWKILFFNLSKN